MMFCQHSPANYEITKFTQVCQRAWEVIYDVSHQQTVLLVREVGQGDMQMPRREPKVMKNDCKSAHVKHWLKCFFENIADRMPDDSNKHGKETMHLPSWMTKNWIHSRCMLELNKREGTFLTCTGHFMLHYQ